MPARPRADTRRRLRPTRRSAGPAPRGCAGSPGRSRIRAQPRSVRRPPRRPGEPRRRRLARARSLRRAQPTPARGRASRATWAPYAEHERAPTTATPGSDSSAAVPADEEIRRRIVQLREQRRITRARAWQFVRTELTSTSRAPSETGTRAPRPRARHRRFRWPASAAIVAATRATRARPRPESGRESTARASSSAPGFEGSADRGASRQPRSTRSRTAADDGSPGDPPSSVARARGTWTTRSKRSSSARESLSRYAASRCGEQEHSAAGSPRPPQGQRFIVPTSTNRAGKTALSLHAGDCDRPVLERLPQAPRAPAGRTPRSSSRKSTPRCARRRLAGTWPWAASADDRRRRRGVVRRAERRPVDKRPARRASRPATEWMRVTSSACSIVSSGRMPGQPAGKHRLPRPGRAGEEKVVPARRRQLERATGALLAPHVGEVGPARSVASGRADRRHEARRCRAGRHPPPRGARPESARSPASAASGADSGGQMSRSRPARRAASAATSAPGTGRTRPSSASSPSAACWASRSAGIWCEAASTARAMGRSKPDPSFRSPAGARLTVMPPQRPLELRAALSRCGRAPSPPGTPCQEGRRSRTWAPRAEGGPRPRRAEPRARRGHEWWRAQAHLEATPRKRARAGAGCTETAQNR